jgi:hypothetical protein
VKPDCDAPVENFPVSSTFATGRTAQTQASYTLKSGRGSFIFLAGSGPGAFATGSEERKNDEKD